MKKALSLILSIPVYLYRVMIAPFLPKVCRHVPSCSTYMLDALKLHGPFTGFIMGINRIMRCWPGGTHGFDPVPLVKIRRYKPLTGIFKRHPSCNRLKV
jgi:hypothetical protein